MSEHQAPIPTEPVPNPEDPGTHVPVREGEDQGTWFTRNGKRIAIATCVLAPVLALLDLTYGKHSHFQVEDLFGFYGFYGFLACVTLVPLARLLRRIVARPEDYDER